MLSDGRTTLGASELELVVKSEDKVTPVFSLSEKGQIDSSRHSLYDLFVDPRIDETSFTERVELVNSWSGDMASKQHYLFRRVLQTGCKESVTVQDPQALGTRQMLNYSSNDYLNLTQHPRVIRAAMDGLQEYGTGSGSSPMLTGTLKPYQDLARKLADIEGCEEALIYTSGYGANLGALNGLLRKKDVAILDSLAHASLIDGANCSNKLYFRHNDLESLESMLAKAQKKFVNKLVVLDGVYSMDGDIAQLDRIVDLAHAYGAWVLVDEAHATGVLGKNGGGTSEYFGIRGKVDVITGTLSKAIGCVGGFVAAKSSVIRYLEAASRPFIFSTAPFVPVLTAALEALHVIEEEPELREKLWQNIRYFHRGLKALGFDIGSTQTGICPLIIGDDFKVKEMATRLHYAGILANPVIFPAVPRHLSRVRMSLTAGLSQVQLEETLTELERIGSDLQII